MNALSLSALGLAQRAAQALPALFTELAQRSPSADVTSLDSSGHTVSGRGAARYVADALADEALFAAHPRFVVLTANGRYFRLLPEGGSLAVEQGGAAGDGTTNDQPAVQAAIDYAEAVRAREVRFESGHYRIDCPQRIAPLSNTRAEDGHPLVIRRTLTLRGCAPDRSVLDFRAFGGLDPESNWQLVPTSPSNAAPTVWRGGGIFLQGEAPDPAPAPRRLARVELDRLVLRGNRRRTGVYAWPANPQTGDGWDISDKALWSQDCYIGTIVCRDTDMIGWKGEILYLGGAQNSVERLQLTRCRLLTTNGSALNPCPNAAILAVDCEFGDCFQAQEDFGKSRAVYRSCLWRDCDYMSLGGGATETILYNAFWPTRDPAKPVPETVLDNCEFRNVVQLRIASWVRGRIRTVDTTVILDGKNTQALRDVDLDIDAWLDQKASIHALMLYGTTSLTDAVTGAPAGVYKVPPSQLRLRLRHYRTKLAEEQGRDWRGMIWQGYIDRRCRIDVEGDYMSTCTPNGGENPVSMPLVVWGGGQSNNANSVHGYYKGASLAASGTIVPTGPAMALQVVGEQTVDLTLARYPAGGAAYGYASGQKLRLVKQVDEGAVRFVKGAATANQCVMATRVLDHAHDWIEFTYNRDRGRWEESGFFSAV